VPTTRVPRGPRRLRPNIPDRLRPGSRARRSGVAQPADAPGRLPRHPDASEKAARFVRTCDRVQHPDPDLRRVPASCPGEPGVARDHPPRRQAHLRLRRGHRAEVTGSPGRPTAAPTNVMGPSTWAGTSTWPGRRPQIAVMGAQGAVNIPVPARARRRRRPDALRARRITDTDTLANPYIAAERGYVDAGYPPGRDPAGGHPGATYFAPKSRPATEEHGNIPLDAMRQAIGLPSVSAHIQSAGQSDNLAAHPATCLESVMMNRFGRPAPHPGPLLGHGGRRLYLCCRGELLFGTSSRRDFRVDAVPSSRWSPSTPTRSPRRSCFRVYCTTPPDRVPTIDQRVIAQMPWVKLRSAT